MDIIYNSGVISAVVLTRNEEKNIFQCLKSVSFCQEVVVIDDNSSDKTALIAESLGAKVFKRNLANNFASQRNFGLSKTQHDWVLFVDADEVISSALAEEIKSKISHFQSQKYKGYFLKRQDIFLNRQLKHGETTATKLLRLAKKDAGKWIGAVHEKWQISGKTKLLINPIIHLRALTIDDFLGKINYYSSLRAEDLKLKGVKTNIFLVFLYPKAKFIQNYFFRLGFLDGIPGFIFSAMMSLHSFMVRSKLWIMNHNSSLGNFNGKKTKKT